MKLLEFLFYLTIIALLVSCGPLSSSDIQREGQRSSMHLAGDYQLISNCFVDWLEATNPGETWAVQGLGAHVTQRIRPEKYQSTVYSEFSNHYSVFHVILQQMEPGKVQASIFAGNVFPWHAESVRDIVQSGLRSCEAAPDPQVGSIL